MNMLVVANEAFPTLYRNMRSAISECHSVDECKNIEDKAAAMAAYCKQLNDHESVRKFNEIRLRSLRRLGEMFREVDISSCFTQKDIKAKVQSAFQSSAVQRLNKYQVMAALDFSSRSDEFFEETLEASGGFIKRAIDYGRAPAQFSDIPPEKMDELEAMEAERAEQRDFEEEIEERVIAAHNEATEEIGVTLRRKDRKKMHEIVFLIDRSIADELRQAAHDHRITQQEILRQGLKMWFDANGYDVPVPSTANT